MHLQDGVGRLTLRLRPSSACCLAAAAPTTTSRWRWRSERAGAVAAGVGVDVGAPLGAGRCAEGIDSTESAGRPLSVRRRHQGVRARSRGPLVGEEGTVAGAGAARSNDFVLFQIVLIFFQCLVNTPHVLHSKVRSKCFGAASLFGFSL